MVPIDASIVGTAMPTVVASLGGLDIFSWVFAGYALVSTTAMPFFGRLSGVGGLPFGAFEVSIAVRMGVLVWCVVQWIRRRASEPEPAAGQPTTPAGADAAEATAA